ncbi:MAG: GNAT family N-acetyltransferase, partial [Gaiellaceae bacterium]
DLAVLVAEADGAPVAATLFLVWQDTLYYKFNASRADALDVRPNDLLIWSGIEHGKSLGLSRLDFGLSDLDQPGLISFKEKYATESGRISALRDKRTHQRPAHEQDVRTILSELTELFTEEGVPPRLTRLAGERLYRYFA